MNRKTYLANCLSRIEAAPCIARNEYQRSLDVVESVIIAARDGEAAAHTYLSELCDRAEGGLYAGASDLGATRAKGE